MQNPKDQYLSEIAGALTPELEGAAHTHAHSRRFPRAQAPELLAEGGPTAVEGSNSEGTHSDGASRWE